MEFLVGDKYYSSVTELDVMKRGILGHITTKEIEPCLNLLSEPQLIQLLGRLKQGRYDGSTYWKTVEDYQFEAEWAFGDDPKRYYEVVKPYPSTKTTCGGAGDIYGHIADILGYKTRDAKSKGLYVPDIRRMFYEAGLEENGDSFPFLCDTICKVCHSIRPGMFPSKGEQGNPELLWLYRKIVRYVESNYEYELNDEDIPVEGVI